MTQQLVLARRMDAKVKGVMCKYGFFLIV